jgi:hypothetical protein
MEAKRVFRATKHIVSFIRVFIVIDPDHIFPLTVDADRNIQYLASLVEAEFAFRYTKLAASFTAIRENHCPIPVKFKEPLVVGQLCDVQGTSYKFEDTVSKVISIGDVIHVVAHTLDTAGGTCWASLYFLYLSTCSCNIQLSNFISFHGLDIHTNVNLKLRRPSHSVNTNSNYDLYDLSGSAGDLDEITRENTSDNRIMGVLRNLTGITLFKEFCTSELLLESLMFWMEVEVFASSPSELAPLMAKYLYFFYIAEDAPLQINLSMEMREDISGEALHFRDPTLFDEAQFHVYTMLKKQIFPKFEKTNLFKDFLRFRASSKYLPS